MFFKKNYSLNFIGLILFAVTFLVGGFFVATPDVFAEDITAPTLSSYTLNSLGQDVVFNPNDSASVSIVINADESVKFNFIYICAKSDETCNGTTRVKEFSQITFSSSVSKIWDGIKSPINTGILASDDIYKIKIKMVDVAGNETIVELAPYTITVDSTPPEITLNGSNPINVAYGSVYTDAGVIAIDNIDGNITSTIIKTGLVDTNVIGTYTIHYNVSDTAHNTATEVTRTVIVAKASQATLIVNTISEGIIYGATATLGTTGGSGTGAVTYSAGSSSGCSVLGDVLLVTNISGTCSVTATKTTDTNYNATTSELLTITLHKANPAVTLLPTATPITYGQTLADSILSGGTSTPVGSFTFTTPTTAPNAGISDYEVTFTPTDITNYNEATGSVSVTVNKATQTTTGSYISPLVVLTPPVTATPVIGQVLGTEKFNFTKLLKFKAGSYKFSLQGTEVMELQKLLNNLGDILVIDGKFGPKTKAAVIKFQLANRLVGDGIVGPITRAVLNK